MLTAIPASSIRWAEKPFRLDVIITNSSVSAAPRLPAGSSQTNALPGTSNSSTNTPSAAPEVIPKTSGLAIGFPVSFWIMVPATASIMPAANAAITRGQRHGIISSICMPCAQYQPSLPRPNSSAMSSASASKTMPTIIQRQR